MNLKGPFRLTALVGERMAAAGGGSIINISSVAAVRPPPTILPYAAAKAGLNTLTQGFAVAFGPTVRVNGIMVGPFLTDISKAWDVDGVRGVRQVAATRSDASAQPAEIVGAALYLASRRLEFHDRHRVDRRRRRLGLVAVPAEGKRLT